MKTTVPRLSLVFATLIATHGTSGQAADVTFLDGGYAELCSVVAKQVERPSAVQLTGSRLDFTPLQICSFAINEESTSRPVAAGNYNNRGVIQFSKLAYGEAIRDFERAIDLQPSLGVAYINLAYAYVAQQKWADAIEPYTKGIELGVEDQAKALLNRGIAYEEIGRIREAYQDYVAASQLAPEWEDPKRELTRFTVRSSSN